MSSRPPLETFLKIEDAFGRLSQKRLEAALDAVWGDVQSALKKGAIQDAVALITQLEAPPWSEEDHAKLHRFGLRALEFGAAWINPAAKGFWADQEDIPILDAAMEQFKNLEAAMFRRMGSSSASAAIQAELAKQLAKKTVVKKIPGLEDINWQKVRDAASTGGKATSSITSNLTTSRLANFSGLYHLRAEGQARYRLEAIIDQLTSEVCQRMHGKVFEISIAIDRLERALGEPNVDNLKNIHPWIPAKPETLRELETRANNELQSMGFDVPPFHPYCRTIVVHEQTVVDAVSYDPISSGPSLPVAQPVTPPEPIPTPQVKPFGSPKEIVADLKLTEAQESAIKTYTGHDYKLVNAYHRNGGMLTPADTPVLGPAVANLEKAVVDTTVQLDGAFAANVAENEGLIFRGVRSNRFKSVQPGDIISDQAYTSATRHIRVAETFPSNLSKEHVIIEIVVKKGDRVLPIEKLSRYRNEEEVILGRGQKLRVLSNQLKPDGGRVIRVELVDDPLFKAMLSWIEGLVVKKKKTNEELLAEASAPYADPEWRSATGLTIREAKFIDDEDGYTITPANA